VDHQRIAICGSPSSTLLKALCLSLMPLMKKGYRRLVSTWIQCWCDENGKIVKSVFCFIKAAKEFRKLITNKQLVSRGKVQTLNASSDVVYCELTHRSSFATQTVLLILANKADLPQVWLECRRDSDALQSSLNLQHQSILCSS